MAVCHIFLHYSFILLLVFYFGDTFEQILEITCLKIIGTLIVTIYIWIYRTYRNEYIYAMTKICLMLYFTYLVTCLA